MRLAVSVDEGIGKRLAEVVKDLKVSRRALARRAGLKSETHVTLIISGRLVPTLPTLRALARAGGVRVAWLAFGDGPKKGPETVPSTVADEAVRLLEMRGRRFSPEAKERAIAEINEQPDATLADAKTILNYWAFKYPERG